MLQVSAAALLSLACATGSAWSQMSLPVQLHCFPASFPCKAPSTRALISLPPVWKFSKTWLADGLQFTWALVHIFIIQLTANSKRYHNIQDCYVPSCTSPWRMIYLPSRWDTVTRQCGYHMHYSYVTCTLLFPVPMSVHICMTHIYQCISMMYVFKMHINMHLQDHWWY